MKILKVVRCFYPAVACGGLALTSFDIARWLVHRGHQVTVFTSDLLDRHRTMGQRTFDEIIEGIRVIYFHTVLRYRWDGLQPDLCDVLDQVTEFDLIHVYGYRDFLSTLVCSFARRAGVPYVIEPMGMLQPIGRSRRKKKAYDRLLGRRLVAGAARVIVTSEQERREALAWGLPDDRLVVRSNGLDLSQFDPLPPPGEFRRRFGIRASDRLVLYLGRISRKKNVPLLVDAFADLQMKDAVLAVVGPDDGDGSWQKVLAVRKRRTLDGSVVLTGPLVGRERLTAYVDADVFVLVSENENFGNAVAEAIACGTPVIISDRCGIAPLVSGRAGLVIAPEKTELTKALRQLLGNERQRREFSREAWLLRERLSWEGPVAQLESLYRDVVHA
jgi:glycosyltransferase involved in cell wall biosynthesis